LKRGKSGRPPKFAGPRRPVTVTLPESTLAQLEAIDCDRARAIVKLAEAMMLDAGGGQKLVEVIEVTPGVGMILIAPSLYLRRIPWLRLVEIATARFLLSVPSGTPVDSLELALTDLFDKVPRSETRERSVIQDLRRLIRDLRLGKMMAKAEMLFVDTAALRKSQMRRGRLAQKAAPDLETAAE